MGRPAYVDSCYAASARAAPERRALEGAVDCDVCVVGGGIAGCSAALHLAERGLSVVLLEEQRVGWGASGRSGGQAIFGVAAGQAKLTRLVGPADARAIWDVSVEGVALLRSLIERFRIDCDWVNGYLLTAVKPRHERELKAEVAELRETYGYPSVRYLPRAELTTLLATERYLGALYDTNSGHLHPLNYTLGPSGWRAPPRRSGCASSRAAAPPASPPPLPRACASQRPAARCVRGSWCCAATYISAQLRPRSLPRSWQLQPISSRPSP
jgi:gamma-glutamylputrescine oxidase